MTSLTTVLFLKRRLLKIAKSPVLSTGENDNSKSRYGNDLKFVIIIIIKYQIYIALISNKCSEALNSATQNIIYKHSILMTSVITMQP